MTQYPTHLQSLIKEIESSYPGNSILQKYKIMSQDPDLKQLFNILMQFHDKYLKSSIVLSLITKSIYSFQVANQNEALSKKPASYPIRNFQSRKYFNKIQKIKVPGTRTLKILSFEVRNFLIGKKMTSYQEIADFIAGNGVVENEKNVRRRVYDVINVLTAAGIFQKRGKAVCILDANEGKNIDINKKRNKLRKLVRTYDNYIKLISRNQTHPNYREAIRLPFDIIASKKTVIFTQPRLTIFSPYSVQVKSTKQLLKFTCHSIIPILNIGYSRYLCDSVYDLIDKN